jgi:uncharacterized protein
LYPIQFNFALCLFCTLTVDPLASPSKQIYNRYMPQVFKLYRLQQFDSQMDQIKNQQSVIEKELKDLTLIDTARQKLEETTQLLKSQQKKITKVEEQGNVIRIKLEQNQASLYGGKINNPKELQDLQTEAISLRKQLTAIENEQLDLMIEAEATQQQVDTLQNNLTQIEQELETHHRQLARNLENFNSQQARLQEERSTIAKTTPEEDLKLYESIRKKRGGVAVAKIVDHACTACGATLSATLLHQAKSPNILAFCDTCNRILYSE